MVDEGVLRVRAFLEAGSPAEAAFDHLIAHARAADFKLVPRLAGEVPSVELQYPDRRRNPFSAQARPGHVNFYLRGTILKRHPGLFEAATERFGPVSSNTLDEYRTHLAATAEVDEMLTFLREWNAWPSKRHYRRLVESEFDVVSPEHILRAARRLATGYREHPFGKSTDYDLLFDELRLEPKAVFGLAASEAFGFEVGPENFRGGEGTACFRILRAAGYSIVSKDAEVQPTAPLSDDDRTWAEGRVRLVSHLRRERGAGLAQAKRTAFRREHGRLFCEECGLDPVSAFGPEFGEACIEVHHHGTRVTQMESGHFTALDDLRCLCANCHRIVHGKLKAVERSLPV